MVARNLLRGHLADVIQANHAQLAAIIRGHWGIEDRLH
jgi:hypothetical protein